MKPTGLDTSGGRAMTFMPNACTRKIPNGSVIAWLVLQPSTAAGSVAVQLSNSGPNFYVVPPIFHLKGSLIVRVSSPSGIILLVQFPHLFPRHIWRTSSPRFPLARVHRIATNDPLFTRMINTRTIVTTILLKLHQTNSLYIKTDQNIRQIKLIIWLSPMPQSRPQIPSLPPRPHALLLPCLHSPILSPNCRMSISTSKTYDSACQRSPSNSMLSLSAVASASWRNGMSFMSDWESLLVY